MSPCASNSTERPVRSPVAELLADLGRGLRQAEARWYLFGARAAMIYGVARLTADVDVTVRLSASTTTEALTDVLKQHRFTLRATDPAFLAVTRVLPLVHEPSGLPVDVVLAGPGLEELFLERAVPRVIDGVAVPVASAEDLIVMKVLAARPKDIDDVIAIVATQGDALDERRVRETLVALEESLGQSDLVRVLDAAIAQARGTRPPPE